MKKLQELYKGDKPREKLLAKGPATLKAYELMAVLLGSGVPGKDVLQLSKEIVGLFDASFESLTLDDLTSIHGMGEAKAAQILAAVELSRRYLIKQHVKITSAADVYELLREYGAKKQEYFIALALDGASHLIEKRVVSIGTLNQSLVHPREVFADAVADRAAGIIVAHNHPGGQLAPSREDAAVTRRLREAGILLGIELLDHVILTKEGFLSLREEGML
ncbi:RadC family protein [Sulfurimonas diazotrophicus]|uniref:DNA repair protein RadC n=1 Tax=Sulfurimonas diazotrophicus TaxID=3131939 RepID=A0ABZ3HEB5_9BACT